MYMLRIHRHPVNSIQRLRIIPAYSLDWIDDFSKNSVSEFLLKSSFSDGFVPPIYNVWKQQNKSKRIEAEKAKRRQREAGKQFGENHPKDIDFKKKELPVNSSQALEQPKKTTIVQPLSKPATSPVPAQSKVQETGKSRDLAAKQTGMGSQVAERAVKSKFWKWPIGFYAQTGNSPRLRSW
jgi:hypothetical protein